MKASCASIQAIIWGKSLSKFTFTLLDMLTFWHIPSEIPSQNFPEKINNIIPKIWQNSQLKAAFWQKLLVMVVAVKQLFVQFIQESLSSHPVTVWSLMIIRVYRRLSLMFDRLTVFLHDTPACDDPPRPIFDSVLSRDMAGYMPARADFMEVSPLRHPVSSIICAPTRPVHVNELPQQSSSLDIIEPVTHAFVAASKWGHRVFCSSAIDSVDFNQASGILKSSFICLFRSLTTTQNGIWKTLTLWTMTQTSFTVRRFVFLFAPLSSRW